MFPISLFIFGQEDKKKKIALSEGWAKNYGEQLAIGFIKDAIQLSSSFSYSPLKVSLFIDCFNHNSVFFSSFF